MTSYQSLRAELEALTSRYYTSQDFETKAELLPKIKELDHKLKAIEMARQRNTGGGGNYPPLPKGLQNGYEYERSIQEIRRDAERSENKRFLIFLAICAGVLGLIVLISYLSQL